ncbi:hypothetical protein G5C64_15165 [Vibrio diabolicus]|uniref:hypothetical protein n=1 Tax=Vibrio diabolicus TaxID=50719 RepID=UPI002151CC51|nr:hypothetical protein [Vibrio diabolicus]MCE3220169.1 hypothetical protein [Vibrio diabolicus]
MNTTNKKRGGSPRKAPEQKQTKDLRCRVTKSVHDLVCKRAKDQGYEKVSEYCRDRIIGTTVPRATQLTKGFLSMSSSHFSNHSQLMRHLNTYHEVIDESSVKLLAQRSIELTKELRRLRAEIQNDLSNDVIMALAINKLSLDELDVVRETIEVKGGCHDF